VIVARVIEKHQENMRTIFDVTDGTGFFKVIFYQKGENEIPMALKEYTFEENTYVRVYGSIRVFKEEKAIVGTKIEKLPSMNELTNHFLQTFVASQIRHKGLLSKSEIKMNSGNPQSNQNSMAKTVGGGGDKAQIVLDLMKEVTKSSRFTHKNDLWTMIQSKMSNSDFTAALENLLSNGTIFTTVDDDTFSVTD
jgi:RPA family protein